MHANSLSIMGQFVELAMAKMPGRGSVLDVGSFDVNGSYRPLWEGWDYTGVDITSGPNVDEVVNEDGAWALGRVFDVAVSGQCLEHCRRPWRVVETITQHVRQGGLICLVAPFAWCEHRYPIDCFRFAPDGMRSMLENAGCRVLRCELSRCPNSGLSGWTDNVDCFAWAERLQ